MYTVTNKILTPSFVMGLQLFLSFGDVVALAATEEERMECLEDINMAFE
jgi:hypothetical protein